MARSDHVPTDALNKVAGEVADLIGRGLAKGLRPSGAPEAFESLTGGAGGQPLNIGDTLSVWRLDAAALKRVRESAAEGDLSRWAVPSELLFHVILLNKEPVAFARSRTRLESLDERALCQLNESPLAGLVSDAVERVNRNEWRDPVAAAPDAVARLLEVPSYQLRGLWVFSEAREESRVLVIKAPARSRKLRWDGLLTTEQFFEGLRERRPLGGIS